MDKIVVKFGGSNLKKREDILKIVRVITDYNRPLVIVVSAFYGITNRLLNAMKEVREKKESVDEFILFLTSLKREVIEENFSDRDLGNITFNAVENRLNELKRYLKGIHYLGDIPEFAEDIILSYGEKLSSLILTSILQSHGINAEEVLPEDMGLITDGEFGSATVDFAKSQNKVSNCLSGDKVYVVPGFYGVSVDGKVTLLGRGGSDYSAASIASCIKAESLDVWKDVDGFMSADPKLVNSPKLIDKLSYTEAAELSYFGAGILHPRTVEPLRKHKIPVRIFNIDTYDGVINPGTVVEKKEVVTDGVVKSVTYNNDFCILTLKGDGVGVKKGVLAKVTNALDMAGINIKSVITSQTAINFLLSNSDISGAYDIVSGLSMTAISDIYTQNQLSTIAVVGEGIIDKHGIAGKMFNALADKGINVRMIVLGASSVAIYFIISFEDRDVSINAIHEVLFVNDKN